MIVMSNTIVDPCLEINKQKCDYYDNDGPFLVHISCKLSNDELLMVSLYHTARILFQLLQIDLLLNPLH